MSCDRDHSNFISQSFPRVIRIKNLSEGFNYVDRKRTKMYAISEKEKDNRKLFHMLCLLFTPVH